MPGLTPITLPTLTQLRLRIDSFWEHPEAPRALEEDRVFLSGFFIPQLLEGSGWRMAGGYVRNDDGLSVHHYWACTSNRIADLFADAHSSELIRATGKDDPRYESDDAIISVIRDPSWVVLESLGEMTSLWNRLVDRAN